MMAKYLVVLFDLKNGFKFEDKGHANEQITWLIDGKMDFYSNGENKTLTPENGGVDDGPPMFMEVFLRSLRFRCLFPKGRVRYKS